MHSICAYNVLMMHGTQSSKYLNKLFSELSIVVTGPIHYQRNPKISIENLTERLLIQIQVGAPRVPIILSSWEKPLFFDKMKNLKYVIPFDPGSQTLGNYQSNLNRQIISTRRGLEGVETKYVLRLRTDFYFENFALFMNQLVRKTFSMERQLERIVLLDYSKLLFWQPFYFCDFIQFGSTELIKQYWQAPLQSFDQFSKGHRESCKKEFDNCPLNIFPELFSPEQYLALHYIFGSYSKFPIQSRCQSTFSDFYRSFKFFKRHFVAFPIKPKSFGGRFQRISTNENQVRYFLTKITRASIPSFSTFLVLLYKLIKIIFKNLVQK